VNEGDKAELAAARGRLTLLFALTSSETRGTALAATAALSNILAYEAGAASFLALAPSSFTSANADAPMSHAGAATASPSRRLISLTREAHSSKDADMLARALTALCALVATGGVQARKQVGDDGGLEMLKSMSKDETVVKLGMQDMVMDAVAALAGS